MTALVDREAPAPADLITGWDHLEFWVGNARHAAQFFASAFGFTVIAYAGPETGVADRASYVLAEGAVRFVVTGALTPDSEVGAHVRRHGDGVHDVAVAVSDAALAYEAALARGGVGLCHPWTEDGGNGPLVRATIATYGDTQHTFVDRVGYHGPFLPHYTTEGLPVPPPGPAVGLTRIDHVVANVEKGSLAHWVDWYRRVLGFDQLVHFGDDQISTEYSALMSTVVWDGSKVVMPLNEPADGAKKSQIQEYLDYYGSPGVQHIALRTDDIVASVAALRERGVRFLTVPPGYYDDVRDRLGHLQLPWDELAALGILIDEDEDGYLLQTFTENIGDRPTLFIEIIERDGAKGFGAGNFKALFEAIEREQARRGNL